VSRYVRCASSSSISEIAPARYDFSATRSAVSARAIIPPLSLVPVGVPGTSPPVGRSKTASSVAARVPRRTASATSRATAMRSRSPSLSARRWSSRARPMLAWLRSNSGSGRERIRPSVFGLSPDVVKALCV
jgi:hypothetical protein